jgi:NitT/TauT family transport system substrate-binding protein
MSTGQTRRRFLANAGLAGLGAACLGPGESFGAEPSPETTEIRFKKGPVYCEAPQWIAEELLRAEGFAIRQVEVARAGRSWQILADGECDFSLVFAPDLVMALDSGGTFTILAGVHAGCFELFGSERIRTIADLKNRTIGIGVAGVLTHLVTIMTSYIGLDPAKDIRWVSDPSVAPKELFIAGKVDAFLAVPPEPQELRALNIGHVLVNSSVDPPWSEYFCCMLTGNADFVRNHPAATKRVVRAVLKGADLCASEPRRVARVMVDRGFADRYNYALQTLNDVPYYEPWRDYDPEDTLRFYALRLRKAGFVRSTPQAIIARGTDWRFLDDVKRELKA